MPQSTVINQPIITTGKTLIPTGSGLDHSRPAMKPVSWSAEALSRDEIIAEALGKLQAIVGRRDLANLTAAEEDTLLRRLKAASWRE